MWLLLCLFICASFCESNAVRQFRAMGYLAANDKNISKFRDTFHYYFYDGEPMNIVCYATSGDFVKMEFSYAARTRVISMRNEKISKLYMKMTTEYNEAIVECQIYDMVYLEDMEMSAKLHLKSRDEAEASLGFEVSGLILPRIKDSNNDFLYEYKYYPDEMVTIRVQKDDHLYGEVTCEVTGSDVPNTLKKQFSGSDKPFTNPTNVTLHKEHSHTSLRCAVTRTNGLPKEHITITFIYQPPDYSPFIGGLSRAKIMKMFSSDTTNVTYITYNTGNDKLYLTCKDIASNMTTEWSYDATGVNTSESDPRPFQLTPYDKNNHNIHQDDIICNLDHTVKLTDEDGYYVKKSSTKVKLYRSEEDALKSMIIEPVEESIIQKYALWLYVVGGMALLAAFVWITVKIIKCGRSYRKRNAEARRNRLGTTWN